MVKFLVLVLVLFLPVVCFAQGDTSSPGIGGLERYISVGPNTYNGQSIDAAITGPYGAAGAVGQGVTFNNGYAVGSIENSGIMSTQVPNGSTLMFDPSWFSQSWGHPFGVAFAWTFYQGIPALCVGFGLALAVKFCWAWFVKLGGSVGE